MTQQVSDRRVRTREVVEKLIKERQEMLVLFCEVAGLEPYNSDEPVTGRLQKFCQVMVDYIALGHFEVYERITKGNERRRSVNELASAIYPMIEQATQRAVDFNDRYASEDQCTASETLAADLSKLGEELALRIEYEDQLIASLLGHEQRRPESAVTP